MFRYNLRAVTSNFSNGFINAVRHKKKMCRRWQMCVCMAWWFKGTMFCAYTHSAQYDRNHVTCSTDAPTFSLFFDNAKRVPHSLTLLPFIRRDSLFFCNFRSPEKFEPYSCFLLNSFIIHVLAHVSTMLWRYNGQGTHTHTIDIIIVANTTQWSQ